MKIRYVGPFEAVKLGQWHEATTEIVPVDEDGQAVAEVANGQVISIPDGWALGLLEQPSNWQPADETPTELGDGDTAKVSPRRPRKPAVE